jgi:hypothetical protein
MAAELSIVVIVAIIYFAILAGVIYLLVKDLRRGAVSNLVAAQSYMYSSDEKKKYNYRNGTITIYRKTDPARYWAGIAFRVLFVLVGIWLGFVLYNKLLAP